MANTDTDCKMMDLSIAIASLLLYIKKNKNYCHLHLDVMSENVKKEVGKQIRQNESLNEKVREVKDDLENYKFQLKILSKNKEDLELELEKVRRQHFTYEKKRKRIFEDNKRLNEKVEQLEINNAVLIDRYKDEIEKHVSVKERNYHLHTTEQTRLKSYISDLEIKTKEYQDKVIGIKLKREKEIQETERNMHQLRVNLQEKQKWIKQKDEVINSNEKKIKDQCAEIDHLREQIKDMEIKNEKEHEIRKMGEGKQIIKRKKEKIFDELESDAVKKREEHISIVNDKLKQCTHLVHKKESKVLDMANTLQTEKKVFDKKIQFYENEIARKDEMVVEINDRMGKMESDSKALGQKVKERDAKIDVLNAQLQQIQKHQDDSQKNVGNIINSKQKLIFDLTQDVEQRDFKIISLEKKIKQESLENLLEREHKIDAAVKTEIAELKRQLKLTKSKLHDAEAKLDDTKTRLSQVMVDRLTDNDRNITDLSDRNRPTKLAEKCAELYDNLWTDAFEVLETYFANDEAVIEALLHILKATTTFCDDKAQYQTEDLGKVIIFADTQISANLPHGVQKQLKNTRQTMALFAVENLRKMFISYLSQSTDQTVKKALEIKEFTFACLELCWFMMVNNPPVAFAPVHAKGSDFNSDLYKPYSYGGTHIDYVVWPALLLHEGGPVLAKGVAQGYNT